MLNSDKNYSLRFYTIDSDNKNLQKWNKLKVMCEGGPDFDKKITNLVKSHLRNNWVIAMSEDEYNCGNFDRRTRSYYYRGEEYYEHIDDIILYINTDKTEVCWKYEQVEDLLDSFIRASREIIGYDIEIRGCIEIK
jgi:hypothetical protein